MTLYPQPLKRGDQVAICSPAGPIAPEKVEGAAAVLRAHGWEVEIMPHTFGRNGYYSGTAEERYDDLSRALLDPTVRAVICSRGGYGVVHILDKLSRLPLADDPKWVAGFSDISALHALMASKGIASIHSSMTAHIMLGLDDPDNAALIRILEGERPAYTFPAHQYDRQGIADGTLLGGNVAVLAELIGTPYDIMQSDTILFIEDVDEPIYKIERQLYQLKLRGVLSQLRGLIVGQFTEYKADSNHSSMEAMVRDMVAEYSYPVAYNVPIGHVDHNIPLIESAHVTLKVSPSGTNSLIFWR